MQLLRNYKHLFQQYLLSNWFMNINFVGFNKQYPKSICLLDWSYYTAPV